jgi:glycosyltransferase involved in cell wall biosynthesis
MKNIRVIHIGKYYHPYIGGTEIYVYTLAEELKKEVKITILASNTRFKTSVEKYNGIDVYRLARLGNFFSLPLTLSLPLWLKREEADIWHFHLPNPLSVLAYFLGRPNGRLVVSYHSDIVRQSFFLPLIKPLLIKFLKKAETIIVTSQNIIENSLILKRFRDKCKVIPCGIDLGRFEPDSEVLQKAEEIKHSYGNPLILFVGRLVYYKGLEYLIKAMQEIEAKLLIVGDGPLRSKLQRLAKQSGVSGKIIWIGEIANEKIAAYYYACDVFVLPSSVKAESFGIVQLEAFACGKPVVSTDLPTGVPFVNLHGQTGLVVPPCNPQALAGAINRLLAYPHLRRTYGENGKERVEKEFNKEKMAEDVLRVYEDIL